MKTLLKKYMQIQDENPDSIVLMILGDFYECLGEKAKQMAEILNLTLTGRYTGLSERVPMCGFPYSFNNYIEKLREYSDVIIFDSEHNSITRMGKIKGKREQIEEMCRNMAIYLGANKCEDICEKQGYCHLFSFAENIYNAGYRKIPENAVVLTKTFTIGEN